MARVELSGQALTMDLVRGGDGVRKGFRFGYRLGLRALDGKAGLGWG